MTINKIGILGAGAWGTALACMARRAGRDVVLWAHEDEVVESVNNQQTNSLYLPDIQLEPGILATTNVNAAIDVDAVLVVTPAQFLRSVTEQCANSWKPGVPAVLCSKGLEQGSLMMMNEVAAATLPQAPVAVLSGPTFAAEVARNQPAAATLAIEDEGLQEALTTALSTSRFRLYRSDDVAGAEVGGVVKNVLAIACGISEGRGLGDNARAALITRGLAEIARLGRAKGGRTETFMGLSGLGDLTLTCNAMQSRNFSLGVALGKGESLTDIMSSRLSVAEGVFSAEAVVQLAQKLDIHMPICEAADAILNHDADIDATVSALLARPQTTEIL
jgi:glycerol-3-phosphate dehydrogenase (NAD(P)+)